MRSSAGARRPRRAVRSRFSSNSPRSLSRVVIVCAPSKDCSRNTYSAGAARNRIARIWLLRATCSTRRSRACGGIDLHGVACADRPSAEGGVITLALPAPRPRAALAVARAAPGDELLAEHGARAAAIVRTNAPSGSSLQRAGMERPPVRAAHDPLPVQASVHLGRRRGSPAPGRGPGLAEGRVVGATALPARRARPRARPPRPENRAR